jgi:hypothetical protein
MDHGQCTKNQPTDHGIVNSRLHKDPMMVYPMCDMKKK